MLDLPGPPRSSASLQASTATSDAAYPRLMND